MESPSLDPALISGDRRPDIIAANVTVAVFAIISVILRFVSRRRHGQEIQSDDWAILLALVSKPSSFSVKRLEIDRQ